MEDASENAGPSYYSLADLMTGIDKHLSTIETSLARIREATLEALRAVADGEEIADPDPAPRPTGDRTPVGTTAKDLIITRGHSRARPYRPQAGWGTLASRVWALCHL